MSKKYKLFLLGICLVILLLAAFLLFIPLRSFSRVTESDAALCLEAENPHVNPLQIKKFHLLKGELSTFTYLKRNNNPFDTEACGATTRYQLFL